MRPLNVLSLPILFTLAHSHGIVTTPPARSPGPASLSACGPAITSIIKADNQSGIEILHKASATDRGFDPQKCNLALCKGMQLADNLAHVQTFTLGQDVNIQVWTRIPHKGWASVAIVDATGDYPNRLIGEPLISFETDSVSGYEVVPRDMDFNVTVPENLEGRCAVAGDCVLQWTWFGRVVKQTYESCIDFVVTSEDEISQASAGFAREKFVEQVL